MNKDVIPLKPMLPTLQTSLPSSNEWVYEPKYDGFRGILTIDESHSTLISRHGTDLTTQFPEIIKSTKDFVISKNLPLILDGEITCLTNKYCSNFLHVQKRGRAISASTITKLSNQFPSTFIAFDILRYKEKDLLNTPLDERKSILSTLFSTILFSDPINIVQVPYFNQPNEILDELFLHFGEGLLAKKRKSTYAPGKRSTDWIKVKNWRKVHCVVTSWNSENDYFTCGILWAKIRLLKSGRLKMVLQKKKEMHSKYALTGKEIEPIQLNLQFVLNTIYRTLSENTLREPTFSTFLLHHTVEDCTQKKMDIMAVQFPDEINLTNTNKIMYGAKKITKLDVLMYYRKIAPYLLPYLKQRDLTLIRCPEGIDHETFYQKNTPDYAPDFIHLRKNVCHSLQALIWYCNQGAIEYHIPFTLHHNENPYDIVIDLDPPSLPTFSLAVEAAMMLNQMLNDLHVHSYVKTSGNKGLQVFIPTNGSFTWKQTKLFTKFLTEYLLEASTSLFTTERLKSKRNERLYIDEVQHSKGKTIIAPYSLRANDHALVSAPLFWHELKKKDLSPLDFSINTIEERILENGDPFYDYEMNREQPSLKEIIFFLQTQKNKGTFIGSFIRIRID
ncbi:DNA ligase D [Bacillus coahuilensis]|uniref:DNA ligase D n=1 Tax=Bacillus coahuilensis TaxID=408580 RepID=UPI0009ECAD7A|nr:DNA ligase D [Bacillus coahuilensis]